MSGSMPVGSACIDSDGEEIRSDHLYDIMFRRGSCEVQLAVWVS